MTPSRASFEGLVVLLLVDKPRIAMTPILERIAQMKGCDEICALN